MRCAKCGADNPDTDRFCGACGTKLVSEAAPVAVPGEEGAYYCYRHGREVTRVRCGHCERPICTRCAVYGPAGVRCRDCARNRVAIRPRGVLHEMGRSVGGGMQGAGRTVWYLAVWYFIISIVTGIFGGRHNS